MFLLFFKLLSSKRIYFALLSTWYSISPQIWNIFNLYRPIDTMITFQQRMVYITFCKNHEIVVTPQPRCSSRYTDKIKRVEVRGIHSGWNLAVRPASWHCSIQVLLEWTISRQIYLRSLNITQNYCLACTL